MFEKIIVISVIGAAQLLSIFGDKHEAYRSDDQPTRDFVLDKPDVLIVFLVSSLLIGTFVRMILYRLDDPVPYNVVIFFISLLFSLFAKPHGYGDWGLSIDMWGDIDPVLILYIFLPPLIMSESMYLNCFQVADGVVPVIILAVPGVIFGTLVMGCVARAIMPYSWDWTVCMIFGAILSTTDPVSVTSMLKKIGVSPKLTLLLVLESLLNDGTSLAIFSPFYNELKSKHYSYGGLAFTAFAVVIGSPVFGFLCGCLIVYWLRQTVRPLKEVNRTAQIIITVAGSYLIFFIAQTTLQISGVLAVCTAGITIAWFVPPIILSQDSLVYVWVTFEWIACTLIFIIVGVNIGSLDRTSTFMDCLICVVLYLFMMLTRVLVVGMSLPFVQGSLTTSESIFMVWSGLRGTLGLTLALIVQNLNEDYLSNRESNQILFFVSGPIILTLVINSLFAKLVLRTLGLVDTETVETALIISQVRKLLKRQLLEIAESLRPQLSSLEHRQVLESCSLLREFRQDDDIETMSPFSDAKAAASRPGLGDVKDDAYPSFEEPNYVDILRFREVKGTLNVPTPNLFSRLGGDNDGGGNYVAMDNSDTLSRRSSRNEASKALETEGRMQELLYKFRRQKSNQDDIANPEEPLRRPESPRYLFGETQPDIAVFIVYTRRIFLEIVRADYWVQIRTGKLPRLSYSARFLLYSIDVGIEKARKGLNDWQCVQARVSHPSGFTRAVLYSLGGVLPFVSSLGDRISRRKDKRAVYILTSFIDAHQHAQLAIHSFFSNLDGGSNSDSVTLEERTVVEESKEAVRMAKQMLRGFDNKVIGDIRVKQAARMLLARQSELIVGLTNDGLLPSVYADELLDELHRDAALVDERAFQSDYNFASLFIGPEDEEEEDGGRGVDNATAQGGIKLDVNASNYSPVRKSASGLRLDKE